MSGRIEAQVSSDGPFPGPVRCLQTLPPLPGTSPGMGQPFHPALQFSSRNCVAAAAVSTVVRLPPYPHFPPFSFCPLLLLAASAPLGTVLTLFSVVCWTVC